MTIFDSIINANLDEVKEYIESGKASHDTIQESVFQSKDGGVSYRRECKTALKVAESLNRTEIVEYLRAIKHEQFLAASEIF